MSFRKRVVPAAPGKTERRIAGLELHEFQAWTEQCLYGVGRALYDYEHDGAPEHLDEAVLAAQTALALVEEYRRRVT